jgi:PAS domain S-box-containing protein
MLPELRQIFERTGIRRALSGRALRYGLAFVAVAAGFGLRVALTAWMGPGLPTYITFYPAVMVVALLAGLGPGVLATVLTMLVAGYWILPPTGQFAIAAPIDRVGLALFAGMGLFMSAVAELYRRRGRKAAAYDRETALRETRREKEFLADVLERASQPFAVGYPDGRLGLCNRAYEQLTGYRVEELRAIDWATMLTPPEWREVEKQKLEELHLTGQPVRYEKEYVRKDGTRVPIELLVHLVKVAGGKPEYYYSFITDITVRKQAGEALTSQRKEQQVILESVPAMIFYKDKENHFVRTNKAFEDAMGRGKEKLQGQSLFDLYPREMAEAFWKDDKEVMASRKPRQGIVEPMETPNGTRILETDKIPYFDESGNVIGIIGFAIDITKRKLAEKALSESRNLLQTVIESTSDAIYVKDLQGRYLLFNSAATRTTGRSADEVFGRDDTFLFPPDQARLVMDGDRAVMAGDKIVTYEENVTVASGGRATYLSTKGPLFDGQGRKIGLFGVARDITERKRAEEALRKLNEELEQRVAERTAEVLAASLYARNLLEASLDALVTISKDGKITDVNRATELVTGAPREQLVGSNFSDYFTEPDQANAGYQKVLAEGQVRDFPLTIRHASGRLTEVLYHATVYRDSAGQVQGVFASARDVTERKRMELEHTELLRRLAEAQETERGHISRELHDQLGQELTALKLGLHAIWKRCASAICVPEGLNKMETLVDSLMRDIHRLAWELRPAALDDFGLAIALQRHVAEWSEHSGVPVDYHSDGMDAPRLPTEIETALYRMTQEALNNVARHAKARRISVLLERRPDHVSLIVEDDGQGFDADGAIKTSGSSGRLGLLGMQERARLAGGTLEIESTPGVGTTAFVRIPLAHPALTGTATRL